MRVCSGIHIRIDAMNETNANKRVNVFYTEQYTFSPTFRKSMLGNLARDSDSCARPHGDKNECVTRISFSKRNHTAAPPVRTTLPPAIHGRCETIMRVYSRSFDRRDAHQNK